MDFKIFFTTFLAMFIAEFGDKTQFAAMAISSQTKSTWTVVLASILGVTMAIVVGIVAGRLLGGFVTPEKTRWISGTTFLLIGTWILLQKS